MDTLVGLPFNIASYALLTHLIAQVTNMKVDELIWDGGDTHIYNNQMEGLAEQLSRVPTTLPTLKLNPEIDNVFDFKDEDIEIVDYNPQAGISFKVAV